jgi:hypothetical protein
MKKAIIFMILICMISIDALAFPLYINKQGILRNSTTGLLMNGTFLFNISFYKQSDNSLQYTEQENITSVNGVYNYIIGRRLSLNPSIFLNDLYINASINNISYQTINFTSIPYSIYSLFANYSLYANNSNYLGGVIAASYATQAWVAAQGYSTTAGGGSNFSAPYLYNISSYGYLNYSRLDIDLINVTELATMPNLSLSDVSGNIGNWSANQSNYVPYEGATRTLNLNFQNITNAGNITADAGNDICVASGYCLSDFADYYTMSQIVTNNNTLKSWAQSIFQNDSEVDTKLSSYWNSSIASTNNNTLKTWIQSTFQNDSEVDTKLNDYWNSSIASTANTTLKTWIQLTFQNDSEVDTKLSSYFNLTNMSNIGNCSGTDKVSGYNPATNKLVCSADQSTGFSSTDNSTLKDWIQLIFQNDSEVDTKLSSYWNSSIASTNNDTLKTWIQSTFQNDSEVDTKLGSYYNDTKMVANNNTLKAFSSTSYVNRTNWTTIDNYPPACGAGLCVGTIGDTSTCINPVASSDSTWTLHDSYPAACAANNYATTIGDTLTCTIPPGVNDGHTHNAANVTAGTFGAGAYTFPSNVTFNANITVATCVIFASGGKICSG